MKSIGYAFAALLAFIIPISAEEGGAGHYIPGSMSTLIDLLPTKPGWVFETMYLRYDGDAEAGVNLPVAGLLSLNLDATSDAISVGGIYTFEPQVFGAYYSVGENTLVAEARWLAELDTKRRLKGDCFWLKCVYQS